MSEELSKVYNPAEVEQKWYKFWEESGFFKPDPKATNHLSRSLFRRRISPARSTWGTRLTIRFKTC